MTSLFEPGAVGSSLFTGGTGGATPDSRLPFNVWLVQQQRTHEQRKHRYVERVLHTQKMPPALAQMMLAHQRLAPGSRVLDPFMGAGTSAVEGGEMGYYVLGSEIVPDYYHEVIVPSLELAQTRCAAWPGHDVRLGDSRDLSWIPDESVDGAITSPSYGDADINRDSARRTLSDRTDSASQEAMKGSALKRRVAARIEGSMMTKSPPEWRADMLAVMKEVRRTLKPGAHFLIAAREYWNDTGMVDLPGQIIGMAEEAMLMRVDQIYALEAAITDEGRLVSRASMHQNRLARKQDDGRACPRGVPGVTRVIVLRRRPKD